MRDRKELQSIMKAIGKSDKLVVWRLDRLARNMKDLVTIVDQLESVGASLVVCDQNIDTGNVAQRAFVHMLGIFAEFETNLRKERQREGLEKARREDKERGINRFKGKQPNKKVHSAIRELLVDGWSPSKIARLVDTSESTVFRVKRKLLAETNENSQV